MFKEKPKAGGDTKTIIGASVKVQGDFSGAGDVLIEGELKGSLTTSKDLKVGEKAVVKANLKAANVYIAGKVVGDIAAENKLELTNTARIKGNISAKILSVEAGARLDGKCTMDQPESSKESIAALSQNKNTGS